MYRLIREPEPPPPAPALDAAQQAVVDHLGGPLLVLTNSVLTMTVLAYAALVRDGSSTIYLDQYAEIGNLVFGTALLGAAVVGALDAAWRDTPLH